VRQKLMPAARNRGRTGTIAGTARGRQLPDGFEVAAPRNHGERAELMATGIIWKSTAGYRAAGHALAGGHAFIWSPAVVHRGRIYFAPSTNIGKLTDESAPI
jgi:hypothetical protein